MISCFMGVWEPVYREALVNSSHKSQWQTGALCWPGNPKQCALSSFQQLPCAHYTKFQSTCSLSSTLMLRLKV